MANTKNLKPPINKRATSEQREIRSKGGKKATEIRRKKKTMREMLDYLLEKDIKSSSGEKITTLEAAMVAVIKKSLAGDVRAAEFIRDTIGQKPIDKTEIINKEKTDLEKRLAAMTDEEFFSHVAD